MSSEYLVLSFDMMLYGFISLLGTCYSLLISSDIFTYHMPVKKLNDAVRFFRMGR